MTQQDAIDVLWSYLCVRNEPESADVIFVFGSNAVGYVPVKAAELYNLGFAPLVLVTGKSGRSGQFFDKSEAEIFAEKLCELGVPDPAIIQEREATNTGDNVVLGMRSLLERGITPTQVIVVSKPLHMRRCIATFAKNFPNIKIFSCPAEGSFQDYASLSRVNLVIRLTEEIDRLERYAELGYLVPQKIPNEVRKAVEVIKMLDSKNTN